MTKDRPRHMVGRLKDADAKQLKELAVGRSVLQLGCYCGKATVLLANAGKRTWVLDDFSAYPGGSGPVIEELKRNVDAGVPEERELYFLYGSALSWGVPVGGTELGTVQLVYRDADRPLETEAADQELAARLLLKEGGIYAWHDPEGTLRWMDILPLGAVQQRRGEA